MSNYNVKEDNPKWNPNPTIATIHKRIVREYGSAKMYLCNDCDNPARDWSWIHDTDWKDIENYVPRCRSCHLKYDDCRTCEEGCTCKRHENDPWQARLARWPKDG